MNLVYLGALLKATKSSEFEEILKMVNMSNEVKESIKDAVYEFSNSESS